MKDFKEVFNLMEKIDPQYRNYMNIKKEINEAMDDEFSFQTLTEFNDYYRDAYNYCVKHMGDNVGMGSSRAVFQIDDERVLKLAINDRGIAQNKVEARSNDMKSPLFPFIYNVAPNYLWLETEFVLPSEEEDVLQCLGLSNEWQFYNLIDLIKDLKYYPDDEEDLEPYYKNDKYGMIEKLKEYILDYDIPTGDIKRLDNWGLAKRDGHEYLVILDPGWTKETMRLYGGWPSS